MNKILRAETHSNYLVELSYSTGETFQIDFSPVIQRGGVFKALEDDDCFQQLTLSPDGRYIEWPGGIDFCADALYEQARSLPIKY